MPKKSFKDNTANLDRLFTQSSEPQITDIAYGTHDADEIHEVQKNLTKEYYRFNLKVPIAYKDFLDDAAWRSKKTITKYLNDLIKIEMGKENK